MTNETRKELAEVKQELKKSNEHSEELKEQLSELNDLIKQNNK